jgi:hypothetical protein
LDVTRLIVRLQKANSPCNFVHAASREVSAELPLEEIKKQFPGFTDLTVDWAMR